MFLSVLPLGTVPKRKGGEKAFGFWNCRRKEKIPIFFSNYEREEWTPQNIKLVDNPVLFELYIGI